MHPDPLPANKRLAWLTVLSGAQNRNSPWLLVNDSTEASTSSHQTSDHCKVTHSHLLQLLANVLSLTADGQYATVRCWQSTCHHFSVIWRCGEMDDRRLFEQSADDYFSRIELIVDSRLLLAFQEPLWPHLQQRDDTGSDTLSIPLACLDALEKGAMKQQSLPMNRHLANDSYSSAA